MRTARLLAVATLATILTACSAPPASEPTASAGPVILAIGDSIPYNLPDDCPGCIGFVQSYADTVVSADGAPQVENRSRHDGAKTADIADQLQTGELDELLGEARVVIVSIGFNDLPPYVDTACGGDPQTDEEAIALVAATTADCTDEHVATVAATAAGVLAYAREHAPDAHLEVLVPYDSWLGWPALDAADSDDAVAAADATAYAVTSWRTALCAAVEKVSGDCVDLASAFNGSDGSKPAGDLLGDDYTHPSQKGNDVIRDLLLATLPEV